MALGDDFVQGSDDAVKDPQALKQTEVFGHRGWSAKYPENTMASFIAALEIGVDGLEFDVHLSKDGEIVVIHDANLSRTTNGQGYVEDSTFEQLRTLDAGSWFDKNFTGQVIPTLNEVLELASLQPRRVKLNIELKLGRAPYAGLGDKVWQKVCSYGLMNETIISSFNHFALRDLKQIHKDAKIAILYQDGLVDPWRYAMFLKAEGLHPHYQTFDESIVRGCHAMGTSIRPYTVNDVSKMNELLTWGVDAIITDHPDVLLAVRARR